MTEHYTFCRICEALCGLVVTTQNGRITNIRPDKDHISTKGFGCAKGMNQHLLYDSPDRLMKPLKRVGQDFVEISWERALAGIGSKIRNLLATSDPDTIAMYVGTAAGFSVLHPVFAQGFMTGLGSKSTFSPATQDCANKFAVAEQMYGHCLIQPFPDIERTSCLIIVGANPAVSKWSFLQVPNPISKLKALEKRGGKLFIIDPRRTETARVLGKHLFIRPGTDLFFYLAFLNELVSTHGISRTRTAVHMKGLDKILKLAKPWTPERTAKVTGIPAKVLKNVVDTYRQADGAALYCSTGVNMGGYGALSFWLQEVINAISGNLDRKGGTLVGKGVIDFPKFAKKTGILTRSHRSRVGGIRSVNDCYPGGILADEILTAGQKQIKALFVTGGNPLITMANSKRLKQAFKNLELLVVTDLFLNETASLAHYVLPATSPFQRPDLPFVFPLMLGMQLRPYLQATEQVAMIQGEQRDEASLYTELCKACGIDIFGSSIAQHSLNLAQFGLPFGNLKTKRHAIPQQFLLDLLLRITGQKGFKTILKCPHGMERTQQRAGNFLGKRVLTHDGKVHLAPDALLKESSHFEEFFRVEQASIGQYRLITRRHALSHNSWTHNHDRFIARRPSNYLYIHPADAKSLGLNDGDHADVSTQTATIRLPVKLCTDLMPQTVAVPHGWGHQHARGLSVASLTNGVNVNLLAPDGPENIDPLSGMVKLTALNVDICPASGPQQNRSWSGTEVVDSLVSD